MNATAVELDKQDSYFGTDDKTVLFGNAKAADGQGPSRKLDIKIKMGTREHESTMVQTLPLS